MTQRRGNGLLADAYVPLIMLAAPHADRMLDALRRSGIAAYAVPLEEDVLEPAASVLDEPPTDRLYVDATERAAAEGILRAELPELSERAIDGGGYETSEHAPLSDTGPMESMSAHGSKADDVWADLVARFYEDGNTPAEMSWPDAENLSAREQREREDQAGEEARDSGGEDLRDEDSDSLVLRPSQPDGAGGSDHEDHYVPPPPPPLPRGDLVSRLSWGGLFGGPVLLLGSMLIGARLPGWLAFCAVAAFIAGFVVLVVRMSDHRPPGDNGPDNGAVV
ncbi:hypothetical protein [Allosalinactinospora lopnorensis]|uniref:hypothetical protein n=1 Tax=Allosalinactinospora lopnorensis TaxID=1352348 RepID=UPI000623FF1C|nr:hypothetical protein [Allosalinactinospora lopnorensis]